jgi:hypothetical protein
VSARKSLDELVLMGDLPSLAKAFTLSMLKAILSGRGDEIVDRARANLRR